MQRAYLLKAIGKLIDLLLSGLFLYGWDAARFVDLKKRNNLPNPNLILLGQHLIALLPR